MYNDQLLYIPNVRTTAKHAKNALKADEITP